MGVLTLSKYTTELRFICESSINLQQSLGYLSVKDIIAKSRTKIFNFDYPIFDKEYKSVLETKIIRHYYTREICEETVGLWKLRLEDKLNLIMPYYNQLYESELLKFNPFHNMDYWIDHKGKENEDKTQDILQNATGSHINDIEFTENYDENTDRGRQDKTAVGENETTDVLFNGDVNTTSHKDFIGDNADSAVHTTGNERNTVTGEVNTLEENATTKEENTTHTYNTTDEDNEKNYTSKVTEDNGLTEKATTVEDNTITDNETRERTEAVTDNTITNTTDDKTKKETLTENIATHTDSSKNESYKETKTTDNTNRYSDTPQGTLENIRENHYLTNATLDNGTEDIVGSKNTTALENGTKNTTSTTDTSEHATGNKTENETKNTTENETTNNTKEESLSKTYNNTENEDKLKNVTDNTTEDNQKIFEEDITEKKNKTYTNNETEHKNKNEKENFNEEKTDKINYKIDEDTDEKSNTTTVNTENTTRNESINTDYTSNENIKNTHNKGTNEHETGSYIDDKTEKLTHNINTVDEYINHIAGKNNASSYSKMLLEFRETFLNIDKMIIEELNDLFFMLY